MLDADQRYFAFSSVALSEPEATDLVREARHQFRVQMPELKASKLLKTEVGRQLIRHLLTCVENRYAIAVHDKVMALGAQFYEYVFEPVFKESPWLLYEKRLNHFVAMVLYAWFRSQERDARDALRQFQQYMRSFDYQQAPLLFGQISMSEPLSGEPLQSIIRFARATRRLIVSDNATIPDEMPAEGRWILDLATTSLWAHLNHWGSRNRPLAVTCDESKPLQANVPEFAGDESDPGIRRARMKNHQGHLGWRLSRPMQFSNSMDYAGLQIADVIAGVTAYSIRDDIEMTPDVEFFRKSLQRHSVSACILPDLSMIDPRRKHAAVSAAMLYRLADRAERGEDLLANVELDYFFAEQAWEAGEFRMG